MFKFSFFAVCLLGMVGVGSAQTKIFGTLHCARPDGEQQFDVGDSTGHIIEINQMTCTWTKPMNIGGVADTEGTSTGVNDIQSTTFVSHGYFVDSMANGDKVFMRYEATVTVQDGEASDVQGKWTYTGGTGKFKGIQGDGTFSGSPENQGRAAYDFTGEYTLPGSN
jgi:hypothetical protein